MNQTPKEYARDLINQFAEDEIIFFDDYYEGDKLAYTKQCARITVGRMMMADIVFKLKDGKTMDEWVAYFQEVIKEIESIETL